MLAFLILYASFQLGAISDSLFCTQTDSLLLLRARTITKAGLNNGLQSADSLD